MSGFLFSRTQVASAVLAVIGVVTLAACGDGDSSGTSSTASTTSSTASTSLSGTAATGRAIADGRVDAKCIGGEGTGVTGANGRFTVTSTGALPCVLRATSADGQTLHSLAIGSEVANITPVSELILARLAGGAPADLYDGFDGATASVTEEHVSSATRAVVERLKVALQGAGIDLASLDDPIRADLVAATEDNPQGNALDRALDALQAALEEGGTSLEALAEAIAMEAVGSNPAASGSSLPPELLLRKAAAGCSSLRSGQYRVIVPMDDAADGRVDMLSFDASTLTAYVVSSGRSYQWTDLGQCRFSFDVDGNPSTPNEIQVAISRAGVGVALQQVGETTNYGFTLMFPEQKVATADLTGSWSSLEWIRDDDDALGRFIAWQGVGELDAAGNISGSGQALGILKANPAGGFDATGPEFDGTDTRMFAYRAGGGELMTVWTSSLNDLMLMTRKRVIPMPVVGSTSATAYAMSDTAGVTANNFSESNWMVSAVDSPVAGSYLRSNGTAEQIMTINKPADGYVERTGTATASPMQVLTLHGMGLTAGAIRPGDLTQGFFMLAVQK